MKSRKPWLSVFRVCFLEGLQYRAAALSGAATQIAFGMIFLFIYKALYASTHAPGAIPLSYDEALTYLWLVQAFLLLLPWRGDPVISESITTGNVANELLRPHGLYSLWLARMLGGNLAGISMRAIPVMTFAMIFFPVRIPRLWHTWPIFFLSLSCALLLSAALRNMLHVALFRTVSPEGITICFMALNISLSGQAFPLAMLPDWAHALVVALPFAGILDTPFTIFLEKLPLTQALLRMGHQLAWILALVAIARWWLSRNLQRLTIAGG